MASSMETPIRSSGTGALGARREQRGSRGFEASRHGDEVAAHAPEERGEHVEATPLVGGEGDVRGERVHEMFPTRVRAPCRGQPLRVISPPRRRSSTVLPS